MTGDHFGAVEHPYLVEVRANRQRVPYMGMQNRVIVQVEAHVSCLADLDGELLFNGIRAVGQRQQ